MGAEGTVLLLGWDWWLVLLMSLETWLSFSLASPVMALRGFTFCNRRKWVDLEVLDELLETMAGLRPRLEDKDCAIFVEW